ncbi:MAG TPA: peroxidase family protein, partial [Kribbellaceae bacterium]|nr:peroxidase family protein [Kribbellaceae bacterium]
SLSNEFATVGYRAHSQIHGEIEVETDRDRYTPAQLEAFEDAGIEVEDGESPGEVVLAIPLNVAFFNPSLLKEVGEGPVLQAMGLEAQYKNDSLIDNQLRSVLFQVPRPGNTECIEPVDPDCFNGVVDLGAIDIQRGREHGMPSYNNLRRAYGLAPKATFRDIVNGSETFPRDPKLTPGNEINDPDSLEFTALTDVNGRNIPLGSPEAETSAVNAKRRTGLAARLKAIYGTVDRVDAFVGMQAEPHVAGSEFGELQRAIWTKQFQALRDGDRFFFGNVPALNNIRTDFGIDFRRTLSQIIVDNTDIDQGEIADNVFVLAGESAASAGGPVEIAAGALPGRGSSTTNSGVDGRLEHSNL